MPPKRYTRFLKKTISLRHLFSIPPASRLSRVATLKNIIFFLHVVIVLRHSTLLALLPKSWRPRKRFFQICNESHTVYIYAKELLCILVQMCMCSFTITIWLLHFCNRCNKSASGFRHSRPILNQKFGMFGFKKKWVFGWCANNFDAVFGLK